MAQGPSPRWKLAPTPQDEAWGLYVTALGSSDRPEEEGGPGWRLIFLVRGGATVAGPGRRRIRLEAGEAVLLEAGAGGAFLPDPARGCRLHQVDFAGWQMERWLAAGLFGPLPRVFRTGFDEGQLGLVARLVELVRSRPPGAARLMAGALGHLLARLETSLRNQPGGPRARLVQEVRRRLADPEGEPQGTGPLAEELGVSETWLRRCFRGQTGLSPRGFRMRSRLDRACELLADTDEPVRAVAERLGFSSQAYFSRVFRQQTGLAPTVWRSRRTKG
ncbi:helix-turn-helix domain-containing protein [Mesoterricola sediminis]|uniref:HTH araC/xylS-type domain-containing protein n=1 Tax=Mesoterricola sediminis TaxID=2927980 RepID=A0AA48KDE2_9BACT|nr:AraC family transcriptional regulator [Mesoterricola sediminis]BDU78111.1 hypothetical protein METESE_30690 [Mesoterricola sediminis]